MRSTIKVGDEFRMSDSQTLGKVIQIDNGFAVIQDGNRTIHVPIERIFASDKNASEIAFEYNGIKFNAAVSEDTAKTFFTIFVTAACAIFATLAGVVVSRSIK